MLGAALPIIALLLEAMPVHHRSELMVSKIICNFVIVLCESFMYTRMSSTMRNLVMFCPIETGICPTLVVCNGSFLTRCAGSVADLWRILWRICGGSVADFVAGLWRILWQVCVGSASDLRRIWWGILTLALAKTTSSIPRQSDEVAMKHNLCRATSLILTQSDEVALKPNLCRAT